MEVVEHLRSFDGSGDLDFLDALSKKIGKHKKWTLRSTNLGELDLGDSRSSEVVEEYAMMASGGSPFPAIIVGERNERGLRDVLDGGHRAQAADFLGRKTICAFVPDNPDDAAHKKGQL
jgi:hypothetical protein